MTKEFPGAYLKQGVLADRTRRFDWLQWLNSMSRRFITLMLIPLLAGASSYPSMAPAVKETASGFLTEAFAPRPSSNLEPLSRTPHRMFCEWGAAAERTGLRARRHPAYNLGKENDTILNFLNGDLSRLQKLFHLTSSQIDVIQYERRSGGDYTSWANFKARHHAVMVKTFFNRAKEWIRNKSSEPDPILAFLNAETTTLHRLTQIGFSQEQAWGLLHERDKNGVYLTRDDVHARLHGLTATAIFRKLEALWNVRFLNRHNALTPIETRERLSEEFQAYKGIVHYPCALADVRSLVDLARVFPNAEIIASDGFVPNEAYGITMPNRENPAAVMDFLRREFLASSYIHSVTLRPLHSARPTFAIMIQFSDFALSHFPTLPRELRLKYKVGLFQDLAPSTGVLYLHRPGFGGRLLFDPTFWRDLIPPMVQPGWILIADHGRSVQGWHATPPFKTPWMERIYTPSEDPKPLMIGGVSIFVWQMLFPPPAKGIHPAHRLARQNA